MNPIAEVVASMIGQIPSENAEICMDSVANDLVFSDMNMVATGSSSSSEVKEVMEVILMRLATSGSACMVGSTTTSSPGEHQGVIKTNNMITTKKKVPAIRRMIYQGEEAEYNLGKPLTAALEKFFTSRLTQIVLMNGGSKDKVREWSAEVSKRVGGQSQGIVTVAYKSPAGKKYKSRVEVAACLGLMPSTIKGTALSRKHIFMSAAELREKHLLTHQLNIFKGSCDNVVYIGDLIRIIQNKAPVAAAAAVPSSSSSPPPAPSSSSPNGLSSSSLTKPEIDSVIANKEFASKFSKHFPVDINTHFVYGNIAVINWGKINTTNPAFHNSKEIYPIGFKCVCLEHDVWLGKIISLQLEVGCRDDKSHPVLRATAAWELQNSCVEMRTYEGANAREVWMQLAQEVCGTKRSVPSAPTPVESARENDSNASNHIITAGVTPAFNVKSSRIAIDSVNVFFDDLVMRLVEGMHGAAECTSYVFFESKENEKNEIANCSANNIVKDMLRLQTKVKRLDKVREVGVYERLPAPLPSSSAVFTPTSAVNTTVDAVPEEHWQHQRLQQEWQQQRQVDERKRQREEKLREEFEIRKRQKDEERERRMIQIQKEKNIYNDVSRRARDLLAILEGQRITRRERARAAIDAVYIKEIAAQKSFIVSRGPHPNPDCSDRLILPEPRHNHAAVVDGDLYSDAVQICSFIAAFAHILEPSFAVPRVSDFVQSLAALHPASSSTNSRRGAIAQLNDVCVCMCRQLTREYESAVGLAPHVVGDTIPLNDLTWRYVAYQLILAGICSAQRFSDTEVAAMHRGRGFCASLTDAFEKRMLRHIRRLIIHDSQSYNDPKLLIAPNVASQSQHSAAEALVEQLRSSKARSVIATRSRRSGVSDDDDDDDDDNNNNDTPMEVGDDVAEDTAGLGLGSSDAVALSSAGELPSGEDGSMPSALSTLSSASAACYKVICELLSHPGAGVLCSKLVTTQRLYCRSVAQAVTLEDVRRCLLSGDYLDSIADFYKDVKTILETFVVFAVDGSPCQLAAFKLICIFDRLFLEMVLDIARPLECSSHCHTCRCADSAKGGGASRLVRCDRCEGSHHVRCVRPSAADDDNPLTPHCIWTCPNCIKRTDTIELVGSPLLGVRVVSSTRSGSGEVVGTRRHCGAVLYAISFVHTAVEFWTGAQVIDALVSYAPTLPSGYTLRDYESACCVASGYCSIGASSFVEPAIASAAVSSRAHYSSDSHVSIAAASILGVNGSADLASPREWTIVMKAIMGMLLEKSTFQMEISKQNAAIDDSFKNFGAYDLSEVIQSCKRTDFSTGMSAEKENMEEESDDDNDSVASSSSSEISWLSSLSDYERVERTAGGTADSAPLGLGLAPCVFTGDDDESTTEEDVYHSHRMAAEEAINVQNLLVGLLAQPGWHDAKDEDGNMVDLYTHTIESKSVVEVCRDVCNKSHRFDDLVVEEWSAAWQRSMGDFLRDAVLSGAPADTVNPPLCHYCGCDESSLVSHMVWAQTYHDWCDEYSSDASGCSEGTPRRFWRPCGALHNEMAALAFHAGSLVAHECCADYMHKCREMAIERTTLAILREALPRIRNGRNVPLGRDRKGNLYFFLSNSVTVKQSDFSSSDSTSRSSTIYSASLHALEGGFRAYVDEDERGKSCMWMQYDEPADIARLVRWLGGEPCDRQLRILLMCLFPEARALMESQTVAIEPRDDGDEDPSAVLAGSGDDGRVSSDCIPDCVKDLAAYRFLLSQGASSVLETSTAALEGVLSYLSQLKAVMIAVSLAIPVSALRADSRELFSEALPGKPFAPLWRAAVQRASDASTLMQYALYIEASIRKEFFIKGAVHFGGPSRTAAIKAPTFSSVAARIISLDASIDYHYDC